MEDILKKILKKKLEYIKLCKERTSIKELEKQVSNVKPARGFIKQLDKFSSNNNFALIAEIKKASPSAGIIREDFNPEFIAKEYERAGAACLSVLTETDFFMGKNEYLIQAKNACSLPVLRKDFMIDVYQVVEAKVIGADCILLIMAMLDDDQAIELETAAHNYGLDVLVEVHNENELIRALKLLKTPLLGINNRNLKTLKTDIATTEKLTNLIPNDKKIVSESGLYSNDDLNRMAKAGAYRFLIGHSLMQSDNIFEATKKLLTNG